MAHSAEVKKGQEMNLLTLDLKRKYRTKVSIPRGVAQSRWPLDPVWGINSLTASSAFSMGHHKWPALMLRDCSLMFHAMQI